MFISDVVVVVINTEAVTSKRIFFDQISYQIGAIPGSIFSASRRTAYALAAAVFEI